jgi:hypothetical protein
MTDALQDIINRLWVAPANDEWTPRTDGVPLAGCGKMDDVI